MVPSSLLLLLAMLTSEQRLIRCLNRIMALLLSSVVLKMSTSHHVHAGVLLLLTSAPLRACHHASCVRVGESWPGSFESRSVLESSES